VPDIVTAERGAPNLLYPGDANLLGDYLTVTADRPILPIPIALRDAPTWYESAYEGTDVATGATIGGSLRLTWGQYKGEVDDTYRITPLDVDGDGNIDLVVGNRDQTAKVYFNDGTGAFEYRTKLGEAYDTGPSAVGVIDEFVTGRPTAVDSTGLATAIDLNGDGYPDVVTGTEVYLNPGHGEFTNVKGMPWRTPSEGASFREGSPTSITRADVDGDGDDDLVVSLRPTSSTEGAIYVLHNPGNGLVADDTGIGLNGWWSTPNSKEPLSVDGNGDPNTGVANAMKALDIDRDDDADLVLAFEMQPPAIWLNPGLTSAGIAPTRPPTAAQGTIFILDATLTTSSDVTLADINGDGRTDILLAYEMGFEVILAPVGTTIADWQAAGAAATKVSAPAMYIKVADMNNDGYLDILTAGAVPSSENNAAKTKTTIYFGSVATRTTGDYSSATSVQVGSLSYSAAGAVLAIDVADVDGDGWKDVTVAYEDTFKRLYSGKRSYGQSTMGWSTAEARRFGPSSQDALTITSLELVDLNLDGNLDVLYAPLRSSGLEAPLPAYVALGRSKGSLLFDTVAVADQELRMRAINFTAGIAGASITSVTVTVGEPNHEHAYAGTTNSECRSPADDFYPVRL
jgi:hypothetical protein